MSFSQSSRSRSESRAGAGGRPRRTSTSSPAGTTVNAAALTRPRLRKCRCGLARRRWDRRWSRPFGRTLRMFFAPAKPRPDAPFCQTRSDFFRASFSELWGPWSELGRFQFLNPRPAPQNAGSCHAAEARIEPRGPPAGPARSIAWQRAVRLTRLSCWCTAPAVISPRSKKGQC